MTVRNILRGDIVKLQSSKASLMPDGIEALFTPQSLADLIAYLKLPKRAEITQRLHHGGAPA